MAAYSPDLQSDEVKQLLKELLAETRRTNKLLAEIRDLEASKSR